MGKYFGTDGIRGRASVQFPPLFVFKLGIAAAHVLSKEVADRRPLILQQNIALLVQTSG